ncbi:MAG TPA: GH-E family nuclease [Clostridia bacterium]
MPYEINISGIDTTFNKCIDWVTCKVDTPGTSNARTNFVGNYMNISGFIGTDEITIDLYNWAMLPVNDINVFRNVQLTVKDANDNVIETVSFPNAFVEFYRESYMRDKGLGKFDLQLKQKIDKNGDIEVSDSAADEKVKSAAESKILEGLLGNASKSDILDAGGSEAGKGLIESKIADGAKNNDSLYSRGGFRKSARQNAVDSAPRNTSGEMICPTCGEEIPATIVQDTVKGLRTRVGYDLDHYPDTWAERVQALMGGETPPTRKEVLDEYNRDLRVQCPECNQSHQFEGIEGEYTGGEK